MAVTPDRVRRPRDFLAPTGYRFFIRRLPNTSFWVQRANVPGLSLVSPKQSTPLANIPMVGDHVSYQELVLSFRVDQDLTNFLEVHDWIRAQGHPDDFSEYANFPLEPGTGFASDATLMILDAKKRPSLTVTFRECIPIALSDLVFDATTPGLTYLSVDATFVYRDFVIERAV